jgi:hypothetical protein
LFTRIIQHFYEILAVDECVRYQSLLDFLHASTGINPIVKKLSYQLQEEWTNTAGMYTNEHDVACPPFHMYSNTDPHGLFSF